MIVALCVLFMFPAIVEAQQADVEVARMVRMLEEGKADQVRAELPSLIAKHQNHPGVLYLQGRLASDGAEAVKFYQSIVDNFPKSEWADDALYHIYQYYYSLGLYRTAELKLQQLRKEYPTSPHLAGKPGPPLPPEEEPAPKVVSPTTPEVEERITPTPPAERAAKPSPEVEPYAIQVGAFSTMQNAEKLRSFFEDLGYRVEVQNKVRGGRSLYLVWVGSFKTADEARKFGAEVRKKHNIESIIVTR